MLNPSCADATNDDPTLRCCISFAQSWGYSSLEVVNLFAYRAAKPVELKKVIDPIGSENDYYLEKAIRSADKIITQITKSGQEPKYRGTRQMADSPLLVWLLKYP